MAAMHPTAMTDAKLAWDSAITDPATRPGKQVLGVREFVPCCRIPAGPWTMQQASEGTGERSGEDDCM